MGKGEFGFADELRDSKYNVVSESEARELVRTIGDSSRSLEERNAAKEAIICSHARLIYSRIFQQAGGRIGIEDRVTELFDSFVGNFFEKASEIAALVERKDISLSKVLKIRIRSMIVDKIRIKDAEKRGARAEHQPVESLDGEPDMDQNPAGIVERAEWLSDIGSIIEDALDSLEGLEQRVAVAKYASSELRLADIADEFSLPLAEVKNAWRRAREKLMRIHAKIDVDDLGI